jgi:hypothetical protein
MLYQLLFLIHLFALTQPGTPTTIRPTIFVTFVETGNPAYTFLNNFEFYFTPFYNSHLAEFLSQRTTIKGIHFIIIIIITTSPETKKVG